MSEAMARKIDLDFEGVVEEIDAVLDELGAIRADRVVAKLLGKEGIDALRTSEGRVRSRLNGDFRLVVAGDFKRGKSTLVNALVGQEVVTSAVTPETVTFNQVSYAETPRVEAVLTNRRRVTLAHDEIGRERLEEVIKELPGEVDHLEIGLPHEMLKGITIVDTPGLGDVMGNFDERVANYLATADAIIFVVSTLSPLSMDERDFLATAVLPQSFSRVLVALNMTDALETQSEEERVTAMMHDRVAEVSDKLYVFPLSALDELCRQLDKRRPLPERADELAQEFDRFRTALEDDILFQRNVIKAERGLALAEGLVADMGRRLALSKATVEQGVDSLAEAGERLQQQDADLDKQLGTYRDQLMADVEAMHVEARAWMTDYLGRLRGELMACRQTAKTLELQRHLQFYLTDKIREGVEACTKTHARAIANITAEYGNDLAASVTGQSLTGVEQAIAGNVFDVGWTGVDTVAALSQTLGVDLLGETVSSFLVLGTWVAGFFREHQLNKRRADMLQPLLANFSEVERGALENVDAVYAKLGKSACMQLEERYAAQVEQSKAAVEHAKEALSEEDVRASDLVSALDDALARVASARERIEALM